MNVLYFNLSIDKNDAPLAFGIDWVDNFSQTAERVDVLTFRQGEYELPSNVTVYSISRSSRFKAISRLLTVIRFYRVLWKLLRSFKYDLCFSHMNIMFINLGGLLCRLYDIPMKLWYAHPSQSLKLRVALLMVHKIVTSFPGAFPFSSSKVCQIGTGISLDLFEPGLVVTPSYDLIYCGQQPHPVHGRRLLGLDPCCIYVVMKPIGKPLTLPHRILLLTSVTCTH